MSQSLAAWGIACALSRPGRYGEDRSVGGQKSLGIPTTAQVFRTHKTPPSNVMLKTVVPALIPRHRGIGRKLEYNLLILER
jgi:hypothetical protein